MGYILTNGDTYISRGSSGKISITYDQKLATVYVTEEKAWNELSHMPRAYKEKHYLPKEVGKTNNQSVKEVKEEQNRLPPPERERLEPVVLDIKDSDELAEFKRNLVLIDKVLGSLNDLYAKKYGELTEAGDSLEDIAHAMEGINANAVLRCYLENEFKKARLKRRECKDMMMLIELISKFEPEDWGTGKLQGTLNMLDNRTYTPRVRGDLFEIKKGA